jgi:outer membrane protein TolC
MTTDHKENAMDSIKQSLLCLTSFLLVAGSLNAQTITREAFLDRLKRIHPLFEKEALTARIEKEDQNSLLGAEDWNVFSSLNYTHEEPTITFSGPDKTDAVAFEGGMERAFWSTGGRLSASYSTSVASVELLPAFSGFPIPDRLYQNRFAVTYAHPLIRNKNGFLDRLQYDLKQYDIDFSEVVSLENREDFLAGNAQKFLDWVYLTEQRRIVQERLNLSEEEYERTVKKRIAHLVDQADVIRAEDAVRIWKQNLMLIESQWKSLQADLAVVSMNEDLYDSSPEFPLYELVAMDPLEEAISRLKENSRLLRALDIRLEQLRYSRRGLEDTEDPDLSLVAQFNLKNTIDEVEDDYFESWKLNRPDVLVGLQFSVPLGNRSVKGRITRTDLQIEQLEKELKDLELSLVAALTDIHIQIGELENVLALNREQIESAKERTNEEIKLYDQGRGELTFVIQSRDNEQNAKLTFAQNALTYQKLVVAYQALMDQLYN